MVFGNRPFYSPCVPGNCFHAFPFCKEMSAAAVRNGKAAPLDVPIRRLLPGFAPAGHVAAALQ
jgi:hypothetical protein